MGRLVKAEFRKVLTTKLWWALLIPAVLLALGWAWGWSALITNVIDDAADSDFVREFNIPIDQLSWSSIALTRSMNIATIFPMVFGGLALASEISRKTITTSFLTAPTRSALLGAKALTYVAWGAIYGVVVGAATSLGVLIGSDNKYVPAGGDWILIVLAGILACLLWTLLGMGVGALLGSPVGTLVLLLIYAVLVGPVSELILYGVTEGSHLPGFLPNGSANGLTGSTATALLFDQAQQLALDRGVTAISDEARSNFDQFFRTATGAPGAFALWISGLIFVAWTMLFFVTGLVRNQRRDIT
jgi:ABC-2 type transport system permease protein